MSLPSLTSLKGADAIQLRQILLALDERLTVAEAPAPAPAVQRSLWTRMERSTAQTIPTSSWTTLGSWNVIESNFDPINEPFPSFGFVIPTDGVYSVGGVVAWTPNAVGLRGARILRDGFFVVGSHHPTVSGATTQTTASSVDFMSAGDLVTFEGFQSSGGNLDTHVSGQTRSAFWIHLVEPL